jgi:Sap, sulfolipid-1-addressing protein
MGWIDAELALVALAAMLSPTTLSFSVLALVLGDRPRRTGPLFLVGALGATLAVGVAAAFVLGNVAASPSSSPKTWVAIVDIVFAVILFTWVVRVVRRPIDPKKMDGMIAQMRKVASSPLIVVVGAGAALANPGAFIPIALKDISETNPSAAQYVVDWIFFSILSVLPLMLAILMLFIARAPTERTLVKIRDWLIRNAMKLAAAIVALLALSLLRNGIAGLAG